MWGQLQLKKELSSNWKFNEVGTAKWRDAVVPGCVHTDLLRHKLIKDPFYRLNEHELQWIDKTEWQYETTFEVPESLLAYQIIQLNFKGLDTYADVFLNDRLILNADNMFRGWEVDCKHLLKKGKNTLRIYFHSPIKKGLDIYDNYPYVVQSSPNDLAKIGQVPGEKWVSPHVRKAPYHFGWDWGPRLVTSGIWEPIELVAWNKSTIQDVYTQQVLLVDRKAVLESQVEIESLIDNMAKLHVYINKNLVQSSEVSLQKGKKVYPVQFEIADPQLWWPNGLGDAYLYDVKVQLVTVDGETLDYEHTLGLRTIELIREKDEVGRSFYFKVNGYPVFMKGANYIPNDVFLDRVSSEKYEHIIQSAAKCHFNMLRVWGGGIYEKEIFYDLCDKYGILVWQDFMFACNMYPGHSEFLESVRQEAIYNVRRLRNHPCVALWCGNNEILGAWFGWGWKQRNEKKQPEGAKAMWQAYKDIFTDILPEVVKQYDPKQFYWASSPQAGDTIKTSKVDGDDHDWRIWFRKVPFIVYHDNPARFVSEYGFQSFPEISSIHKFTTPEDHDIYSEVLTSHQRSGIGNGTIEFYLNRDYRKPKDFESFIYTGLVLQAEGIKTGIEGHRMNKPVTMGSLYWQLNDVWPAASWSSIDYYGNWKALQYFTREAFKQVVAIPDTKTDDLKLYVVSDRIEPMHLRVELSLMDFQGKLLWSKEMDSEIAANASQVVFTQSINDLLGDADPSKVMLTVRLSEGHRLLYQTNKYFKQVKELELPMPQVKQIVEKVQDGYQVTVSSNTLAKNAYLRFEGIDGWFEDNYFDLLPGEERKVLFKTEQVIKRPDESLHVRTIRDTYE
jgi:beta-mannosidase